MAADSFRRSWVGITAELDCFCGYVCRFLGIPTLTLIVMLAEGFFVTIIAEREGRQLIVQCGGQIWLLYLSCNALECNYCGPAHKLRVGPPCARIYNPHAHHVISPLSLPSSLLYKMDEYESVSDKRRQLTRQRVQRHRGRTDEARRETARAADRKRLGRQNEVDVRHSQRLAITRGYVLQLPNCIKASREASLRGQPRMH